VINTIYSHQIWWGWVNTTKKGLPECMCNRSCFGSFAFFGFTRWCCWCCDSKCNEIWCGYHFGPEVIRSLNYVYQVAPSPQEKQATHVWMDASHEPTSLVFELNWKKLRFVWDNLSRLPITSSVGPLNSNHFCWTGCCLLAFKHYRMWILLLCVFNSIFALYWVTA